MNFGDLGDTLVAFCGVEFMRADLRAFFDPDRPRPVTPEGQCEIEGCVAPSVGSSASSMRWRRCADHQDCAECGHPSSHYRDGCSKSDAAWGPT